MAKLLRSVLALAAILFNGVMSVGVHAQSAGKTVSLEVIVEHRKEGAEHLARITLRNAGKEVVTLLQDNLPWGPSLAGMQLQAWRAMPPYAPLKKTNLFAHSDKIAEIKPGEAISGVVRLSQRFPELDTLVQESDVMFFWGYRAMPLGPDLKVGQANQSPPTTGSFVIRGSDQGK